jgi:hypothetical protein
VQHIGSHAAVWRNAQQRIKDRVAMPGYVLQGLSPKFHLGRKLAKIKESSNIM